MKWFKTPFDTDRSHERIMAILEAIDPVELFGAAAAKEPAHASTNNSLTTSETRE